MAALTLWSGVSAGFGAFMPWVDTVTSPAAGVAVPERPLSFPDVRTLEDWQEKRQEVRRAWLEVLGPLPQAPVDGLKLEIVADESLSTCSRQLVTYEAEPGRRVRAYLLRPMDDQPTTRPGIVVFHPTNKLSIQVVAGTGGRPDQHLALRLVERGYVCLCPENYINTEDTWLKAVAAAKKRHPASTGMATMVADGMRAVDVLSALPGVDPARIGTIGHSLGAKQVLYLMAFDERVKAGVFSEGGIGLKFSNWDAEWYLGKQVRQPDFQRDHDELLALIVPRALLVFGGEEGRSAADGDRSWPFVLSTRQLYRWYGMSSRMGLINHREGHSFSPEMARHGFSWLGVYLEN